MPGVQRFLANDRNLLALPGVVLAADSVRSATGTVFRGMPTRSGFGRVSVSGTYTGEADADIDIQIVDAPGDGLRISQPVFIGSGNGTLASVSAEFTTPQTITVRLVSAGINTASAKLNLGQLTLVADATGAGGNGIVMTITPNLTLGATIGALPAAVSVGQSTWTGAEWDWGVPALLADGTVPAEAPRIVFGSDTSVVYRAYKNFISGTWSYSITPPIAKEVTAGALIQLATGNYTVFLEQDDATEEFPALTTIYDLARALESSELVGIEGVVVDDRTPGGLGVIDVPFRTVATARIISRSGSKTLMDVLIEPVAVAGAASQIITVECTDNTIVGSEVWSVLSDVAGAGVDAISGLLFDGAAVFTIPQVFSDPTPLGVTLSGMTYVERPEGGREPAVCLRFGTQGAQAQPKTLTLIYTPPPPTGCDCDYAQVSGIIDPALLGLEEVDMSTWDPIYEVRIIEIADYLSTFVSAQVEVLAAGTVPTAVWSPSGSYSTATTVLPPVSNGHYYEVQWTDSVDVYVYNPDQPYPQTITQYTITVSMDEFPWPLDGGIHYLEKDPAPVVTGLFHSQSIARINPYLLIGYVKDMGVIKPQMTGAKDDIQTVYTLVKLLADNLADVWANETALGMWDALWIDLKYELETAAIAGAISDVIFDPTFAAKYEAKIDAIRVRAGLLPKKFSASGAGSAVWRDHPDQYRWAANDGYLPWWTNEIGYTAKSIDGVPYSTQEAAFALACACPESLMEGDTATISILSRDRTYAVGDKFVIAITGGQSLITSGGVTGNDTLTWSIKGELDSFADYALTLTEPVYSDGGLELQINRGMVPFVVGDEWRFSIEEQGQFKWRIDNGEWSIPIDIGTVELVDGLTVSFTAGLAPAFVPDDNFPFDVVQPYAADHVIDPLPLDSSWQWEEATAELTIDLLTDRVISAAGILIHSLPADSVITLGGGDAPSAADWDQEIEWRAGPIIVLLEEEHTCRYLRLTIGNAADGSIGWLWVGEPLQLSRHAITCELRNEYKMARSSGLNPTARAIGKGWGGVVEWENLAQTDVDALLELWDGVKVNGDEPIGFMPHYLHSGDARLVGLAGDELNITDVLSYQPDVGAQRRLGCSITLRAIAQ